MKKTGFVLASLLAAFAVVNALSPAPVSARVVMVPKAGTSAHVVPMFLSHILAITDVLHNCGTDPNICPI